MTMDLDADDTHLEQPSSAHRPAWVRVVEKTTYALLVPAVLACIFMVLQIIVDIVGRTFFESPLKGTMDMTSDWWMVAMVFMALAYAQLRNEHIRATMVTELLPDVWARCAEIGTTILVALLALAMAYFGWTAAMDAYSVREASDNVRSIPLWPFRFLISLGCVGLAFQCAATIYEIATGAGRESHSEGVV